MKKTVTTFQSKKDAGNKITMLTAYDYSTAKLVDSAGIDGILVGDSLGMVMLGYDTTLSVTMEDMIHHGKAVANGAKNSLIVIDMPFMSYQTSVYDAVTNAGRLIKEGHGHAVKLEGGEKICPHIKAISNASIPVMGHIGLTPQSVNEFGGYKVQGKTEQAARQLIQDAKAIENAGAFALVLECVPSKLARMVTKSISIPIIGIGAGADCDGQILVYQDLLGMYNDIAPKFVKQYRNLGKSMKEAFSEYKEEVEQGIFPEEKNCFSIDETIINSLEEV